MFIVYWYNEHPEAFKKSLRRLDPDFDENSSA